MGEEKEKLSSYYMLTFSFVSGFGFLFQTLYSFGDNAALYLMGGFNFQVAFIGDDSGINQRSYLCDYMTRPAISGFQSPVYA